MSETKTPARMPAPRRGPGGGGPFGGAGMPAEKAMNFGPTAKRLLGRLRPEAVGLVVMTLLTVASVTFSVLGPKLLGEGTNIIVAGFISKSLPAGATKAQVLEGMRKSGQGQVADMLSGMNLTPGHGIDFTALSHVLMIVLALYVFASVFSWL